MWFLRLKNCIRTVVALLCALLLFAFAQLLRMGRFADVDGERTFYLYSSSSQAAAKESLFIWELFYVQGESVRFACVDREQTLGEILNKYDAVVCFVESAGESISYYCQTAKWKDGVHVNGALINLHVAFHGDACVVGSPIIFGGF